MILSDETRADYLRHALSYINGLPLLIEKGRPDQVAHEIGRLWSTVADVLRSLEAPPTDSMTPRR